MRPSGTGPGLKVHLATVTDKNMDNSLMSELCDSSDAIIRWQAVWSIFLFVMKGITGKDKFD